jgi:hypothetical protein
MTPPPPPDPPPPDPVPHARVQRPVRERPYLPAGRCSWLDDYIVELIGFPGTKYDDQVDSTTQALDHMREDDVLATYLGVRSIVPPSVLAHLRKNAIRYSAGAVCAGRSSAGL